MTPAARLRLTVATLLVAGALCPPRATAQARFYWKSLAGTNVIPLVDIMLVLLIIFIITIPVMTHAVKIDLPRDNPNPPTTPPEDEGSAS